MSRIKNLPLIDLSNRSTASDLGDLLELGERLGLFVAEARQYIDRFAPVDDSSEDDPDTHLSRTQLLSLRSVPVPVMPC